MHNWLSTKNNNIINEMIKSKQINVSKSHPEENIFEKKNNNKKTQNE